MEAAMAILFLWPLQGLGKDLCGPGLDRELWENTYWGMGVLVKFLPRLKSPLCCLWGLSNLSVSCGSRLRRSNPREGPHGEAEQNHGEILVPELAPQTV